MIPFGPDGGGQMFRARNICSNESGKTDAAEAVYLGTSGGKEFDTHLHL